MIATLDIRYWTKVAWKYLQAVPYRTLEDAEEVANSALYDHLTRGRPMGNWGIIDAIRRVIGQRKKRGGEGLTTSKTLAAYRPLLDFFEGSTEGYNPGDLSAVDALSEKGCRVFSGSVFPGPEEAMLRGLSFRHGLIEDVPEDPAERIEHYARYTSYDPAAHAERVVGRAASQGSITADWARRLPIAEMIWDWATSGERQVDFAAKHGKHPGTLATQANALGMKKSVLLDPKERESTMKKPPTVQV